MELRHLRYFVAVAEERHVGRAAARLRVAQPPLSRQIQDLEREIGVALFVRHPRGMALTAAGEAFLVHARALLADAARAVEHVRRVGTDRQVLRVGVITYGVPHRALRAAIADFRARYPHVGVEVAPLALTAQPAAVRAGTLDVGFVSGPWADAAGLALETLLADPLVAALVPAAHPLAAAPAVEPADLSGELFVGTPEAAQPAHVGDMHGRLRAGGWRGRRYHGEPHQSVMMAMAACGAGYTVVPRSLGPPPEGTAARPLASGPAGHFDWQAVTRAGEAEPGGDPLAAAFLAGLRAARDEPGGDAPAPNA